MPRPTTPAAPLRRRPLRTVTAVLEKDGYAGSALEMRSNAPLSTLDRLDDLDDVASVRQALAGLIVTHNLVDEQGAALDLDPPTAASVDADLLTAVEALLGALSAAQDLAPEVAIAASQVRALLVKKAGERLPVAALTNEELWMIIGAYFRAMKERTALPKDDDAS